MIETGKLKDLTDYQLTMLHEELQEAGIDMWLEGDANDIETINDWDREVDRVTQEIINRFTAFYLLDETLLQTAQTLKELDEKS